MGRTYTAFQFGAHLFRSRRWDAFHSPYLFRLFTHCCDDSTLSPSIGLIEKERTRLKDSAGIILRQDYGAGSSFAQKSKSEYVSAIARRALSLPFQCRFLYRLAAFTKPRHIVEFGTSLGISTAYLGFGAPEAVIDTVEGDPEISKLALTVFRNLGLKNITLHTRTFDTYISQNTEGSKTVDLLFLDGHHTSSALLHYYKGLKGKLHAGSIIVVDDIYWSADMHACWKSLICMPGVTQSVDCFHFGLLFFNPDFKNRENHIIRLPLRMQLK
jgi:predicted O-methyltransferase YrrM